MHLLALLPLHYYIAISLPPVNGRCILCVFPPVWIPRNTIVQKDSSGLLPGTTHLPCLGLYIFKEHTLTRSKVQLDPFCVYNPQEGDRH